MRMAARGGPPPDPLGPGVPIPLAQVGADMRGERAGEVHVEEGLQPDNSRAEGFFGRLKVEFFYGRDWAGVTLGEFIAVLDAYLRWYRDIRIKSDLGYKSPMRYRRDLVLAA